MKLKFTIFILLIFTTQIFWAQADINKLDSQGKRHGVYKKYYKLNNNLRYTGQFNHGKEIGTFKYYDINNDEIPVAIRVFNSQNNTCEVSFFTTKGILVSKGKMLGKKRIGKWLYFQKDGKSILSEENYEGGLLNGELKVYYNNGRVTEISHYLNGKLEGNYKRYSVRGFLYQELTYKEGELNGMATYYERKNGKILSKGLFKENKRVGTWQHYENGKLISTDEPAIKTKKNNN